MGLFVTLKSNVYVCESILFTSNVCDMSALGPKEPTQPYGGSVFVPPGLTIVNDFISADEEEELLADIDWTNAECG